MNYIKHLIKILLLAQCFLLFCEYDKKVVTTEQNISNLADFVKCPFNEEFDKNTDLEKYVLKKFGKPDIIEKWRDWLGDHSERFGDKIRLVYDGKYLFYIHRWVFKSKKFEIFKGISIYNYADLKHGINKETTKKDIENLFGPLKGIDTGYYCYNPDGPYIYHFNIGFEKGKVYSISIRINIGH